MYYNVAAMAEAMGISEDEVTAKIDSVVTWDDYQHSVMSMWQQSVRKANTSHP